MSWLDVSLEVACLHDIKEHIALLALAADGAIADGDDALGRKFRAAARAIEADLDSICIALDRQSEEWRLEQFPATPQTGAERQERVDVLVQEWRSQM